MGVEIEFERSNLFKPLLFGVVYAIWQVMTAYQDAHGRVAPPRWMTWPPFALKLKAGNVLLKNSTDAHPLSTI